MSYVRQRFIPASRRVFAAAFAALAAVLSPGHGAAQNLVSQVNGLLNATPQNNVATFAAVGDYGSSGGGSTSVVAKAAQGVATRLITTPGSTLNGVGGGTPSYVLSLGDQLYGPFPVPTSAGGHSFETTPLSPNDMTANPNAIPVTKSTKPNDPVSNSNSSFVTAVGSLYGKFLGTNPLVTSLSGGSGPLNFFPTLADHDWWHETLQYNVDPNTGPIGQLTGSIPAQNGVTPGYQYSCSSCPNQTANIVSSNAAFYNYAQLVYSAVTGTPTSVTGSVNIPGGTVNGSVVPGGGYGSNSGLTLFGGTVYGSPGATIGADSYETYFAALYNQSRSGINSQTPSGTVRWYDTLQNVNPATGQASVHVFALDSDTNEMYQGGLATVNVDDPNASTKNLVFNPAAQTVNVNGAPTQVFPNMTGQGQWFLKALQASTATWNIVEFHEAAASATGDEKNSLGESEGGHASSTYMQWFDQGTLSQAAQNLAAQGTPLSGGGNFPNVDLVLGGHVHAYERLYNGGITYINNGAGGTFESFSSFCNQANAQCSDAVQVTPAFASAALAAGNALVPGGGCSPAPCTSASNSSMLSIEQMQAGYVYSYELINISPQYNYLEAQAWGSVDPGGVNSKSVANWVLMDDLFILKNGMINAAQASTATGLTLSIPNGQTSGFGIINTQGQNVALNATINGPGQLVVAGGGTLTLGAPVAASAQILNGSTTTPLAGCTPSTCTANVPNVGQAYFMAPVTLNEYSGGTYVLGGTTLSISADCLLGCTGPALGTTPLGALTLDQGTLQTTQAFATSRAIILNSGNGSFNPQQPLTLSGPISGPGGLVMTGPSSLTLSGPLTYSGGTLVAAGTLSALSPLPGMVAVSPGATLNTGLIQAGETVINNGTLGGPVTIAGGGALGGHGAVNGNLTVGGAIVTTGVLGATPIAGSLTFQAGSSFQPGIGTASSSDSLSVSGKATLAGTVLPLLPANFNGTFGNYTILSAGGGVSGQFSGLAGPFGAAYYPYLGLSLSYTATSAQLAIGPGNFATGAATGNQAAAGAGLNALAASNPLVAAVAAIPTLASGQTALRALSGDIYGSTASVMQQQGAVLRDAVGARIRQAVAPEGGPQLAALGPVAAPVLPGSAAVVWQQALGVWGSLDSAGNATGIDRSAAGYVIGLDAPLWDGWRGGLASGFDQDWFNSTGTASSASMTGAHLAGYAGRRFGAVGVELAAANTWYSGTATRTVAFSGFSDSDRGGIGGTVTQVFGEATLDQPLPGVAPGLLAQPFVAVAYAHVDSSGLSETGGAAALRVNSSTLDDTYTTLGARGAVPFELGGVPLKADGMAGWQHSFGPLAPSASLAFAGGAAPFTVQGVPLARDTALVGAGLRYDASPSLSFALGYTGRLAAGVTDNQVNGTLTIRF